MSVLANGIELMELGSTAWRVIINNNFSALYTKTEVDALGWDWSAITSGVPTTIAGYGITDAYTKSEVDSRTADITFTDDTKGVVLTDRTTATQYRLYVDNGTLSIEAV